MSPWKTNRKTQNPFPTNNPPVGALGHERYICGKCGEGMVQGVEYQLPDGTMVCGKCYRKATEGPVIKDAPDIVGFDYLGTRGTDDGQTVSYTVKYADGHTAEVEFSDQFSPEASEMPYDDQDDMDVEEPEDTEMYTLTVIWDGAVDYEMSYDAKVDSERSSVEQDLLKRYGKIAEDYLGKDDSQIAEDASVARSEAREESFL